MDKAILRKFAVESKQDLTLKINSKIKSLYIEEEFDKQQNGEIFILTNNKHTLRLSKEEYEKRELLKKRVKEKGFEQVIEEAAYTWFNRIVAIRYMEINDYLPLSHENKSLGIRVLSSKDNTSDPEIMKFTNLINPELDINFKKEIYSELVDDNEKFKYILLSVSKKLSQVIPQVFGGVTDYIDILIPENLLNDSGFVNKIVEEVSEKNFSQVEIIGWLYQYYNQAEKDRVISAKKIYKKNEIPFATQLFTPDWIVKYMVENSLGKYWVEHNKEDFSLTSNWSYFIKNNLSYSDKKVLPTELKVFDPCCGSGHILVYMFDVLYQIYEKTGYNRNDISEMILKNNIFGLDLDDRAGQLSVLSVILKAREYDKNIFSKSIIQDLNISSIQEFNDTNYSFLDELDENCKNIALYLINSFKNGKEVGSLTLLKNKDYSELKKAILNNDSIFGISLRKELLPLIKQAEMLSAKYDVVVTNPPYMNTTLMGSNLKNYVIEHFKEYKFDLFSSFMVRNLMLAKENGQVAFMTPYVWMFISSYEPLRRYIVENYNISSLIQLEYSALEEAVVPLCSFVIKNSNNDEEGTFVRLTDFRGGMKVQESKYIEILNNNNNYLYNVKMEKFKKIPSYAIAYWISNNLQQAFSSGTNLKSIGDTRQGMATSDNNRFLRLWYEVDYNKMGLNCKNSDEAINSKCKWFPYNKGGYFRKWYGNIDYVINYENDGQEVKGYASQLYKSPTRTIKSISEYFKDSISWSKISSGDIAFRYYPNGFIFDVAGCCIFTEKIETKIMLIAFLNSLVSKNILKVLSPTLNYEAGQIATLPILTDKIKEQYIEIECLVNKNIEISKEDWNSFETSWDFKEHPLIKFRKNLISENYKEWQDECENRFVQQKSSEEGLNKIFIDIYGLNNELSPEISDNDITVRKADKLREIKSLISYAVGCIFGRYSLDKDGLIYAGGIVDESNYSSFKIDEDNIIPITDEAYFGDDIVSKFKSFIEVVYGKETLNENIDYIAETLGKKGTETSEETIRRYFLNDFYADHIKMYQKKPIYWLFDSGKKNGFKALIYMHRYNENTVPKVRLDYLHRIQTTYEKLLTDINYKLTTDLSMTDKKEAQKRQVDLNNKLTEIKEYDEKIAHIANQRINIDLDDGVTVNYAKFADILAKIK